MSGEVDILGFLVSIHKFKLISMQHLRKEIYKYL